jgi:hypothetical protein
MDIEEDNKRNHGKILTVIRNQISKPDVTRRAWPSSLSN